MKKLLLLATASLLTVTYASSQNSTSRYFSTPEIPSNVERYNVDYTLKNYVFVNGDSTILEQIDLASIEHLRSATENVELLDNNTGEIIILFYSKRKPTTISTEKPTKSSNL